MALRFGCGCSGIDGNGPTDVATIDGGEDEPEPRQAASGNSGKIARGVVESPRDHIISDSTCRLAFCPTQCRCHESAALMHRIA